jgi:hypothetical protein
MREASISYVGSTLFIYREPSVTILNQAQSLHGIFVAQVDQLGIARGNSGAICGQVAHGNQSRLNEYHQHRKIPR